MDTYIIKADMKTAFDFVKTFPRAIELCMLMGMDHKVYFRTTDEFALEAIQRKFDTELVHRDFSIIEERGQSIGERSLFF